MVVAVSHQLPGYKFFEYQQIGLDQLALKCGFSRCEFRSGHDRNSSGLLQKNVSITMQTPSAESAQSIVVVPMNWPFGQPAGKSPGSRVGLMASHKWRASARCRWDALLPSGPKRCQPSSGVSTTDISSRARLGWISPDAPCI